jgi:hypothetical protein
MRSLLFSVATFFLKIFPTHGEADFHFRACAQYCTASPATNTMTAAPTMMLVVMVHLNETAPA